MSDEQIVNTDNNNQAVSSYVQGFVGELDKQQQRIQDLSSENLKQMLLNLPDAYKAMAVGAMAEQLVNSIKLYLLHLAATYYRQAESEGIDPIERDAVLRDTETEIQRVMELNQNLSVHGYEDLFKLAKITAATQDLSKSKTADDAEGWLYNLPFIYTGRLEREHLVRPLSEIQRRLYTLSLEYMVRLQDEHVSKENFDIVVKLPTRSIVLELKMQRPTTKSNSKAPSSRGRTQQHITNNDIEQWGKVFLFPGSIQAKNATTAE
jgi:hypothetical protein